MRHELRWSPSSLPKILVIVIIGLVGLLGFAEHHLILRSLSTLAHVQLRWLVAAAVAESLSLASLASAHRRLLHVGGVRIGRGSAVAVISASNAISGSIPVAGSEMGTAYTFHQYQRRGADRLLAAWTVGLAGLVSSVVFAVIVGLSAATSGSLLAAVLGGLGTLALLLGIAVVALALRRPRSRARLLVVGGHGLRFAARVVRRPLGDPEEVLQEALQTLAGLRLRVPDWASVVAGSTLNWLADILCLVLAIKAMGQPVPWVLLGPAWVAGATASSLSPTPGGLGVVEAALTTALVAAGLHPSVALGSVLVYRAATFWLPLAVGWVILLVERQRCKDRRESGDDWSSDAEVLQHETKGRRAACDMLHVRALAGTVHHAEVRTPELQFAGQGFARRRVWAQRRIDVLTQRVRGPSDGPSHPPAQFDCEPRRLG